MVVMRGYPLRGGVPTVRRPYNARLDSAAAWDMVAADAVIIITAMAVLATVNGSHPPFCSWWPTGRMVILARATVIGLIMALVSLRHCEDVNDELALFDDRPEIISSPEGFMLGRSARMKAKNVIAVAPVTAFAAMLVVQASGYRQKTVHRSRKTWEMGS